MLRSLLIASAFALAACGQTTTPEPAAEPASEPVAEALQPSAEDTCNAAQYADLVGANIAAVTLPQDPKVRVVMPGQPVTDDLRPDRANLITDANGVILRIECY